MSFDFHQAVLLGQPPKPSDLRYVPLPVAGPQRCSVLRLGLRLGSSCCRDVLLPRTGRARGRWWKQAVGRLRRGGASAGVWWSELVRGPCPGSPCRAPAGPAGPRTPRVTVCAAEAVLDSGANTWDCSPPPRVTSASLSQPLTRVDSGFTASWHFSGYVCNVFPFSQ